jgi:hypothetical protein
MSEIFFGKSKSLDRFLQWAADHKVALHYIAPGLGCSCASMRRHVRNNDLLGSRIPKMVDPQATLGITRIAAVLYMPVGGVLSSLPLQLELIASAGRIPDPILDGLIPKVSFATAHAPIAIVDRQP